jgi:hypothetical protein
MFCDNENNNSICECPICMEEIYENKNKIITECGHIFHTSCLMKNASHNGFGCPYCRTKMADEPEEDEDDDDEYYEDDDEEEYAPDYNNYVLNGARWLFQRAEGEELDDDNEDDDNPEEENLEDEEEAEVKPTAEYITEKLQNMYGITMEDVIRSLLFVDHEEYERETSFKSIDSKIFNLTRRIINQFSDERNEVINE